MPDLVFMTKENEERLRAEAQAEAVRRAALTTPEGVMPNA